MNKPTEQKKIVRDLVIPLTDYPHMPYWATLKEAVVQLTVAQQGLTPAARRKTILVFDEAYRLQGMLAMRDILQGIEPKFSKGYGEGIKVFWDDLYAHTAREQLGKAISEFMTPVAATVEANENLLRASHIMLSQNTTLLPVMEEGTVLGVIKLEDIFQEISMTILSM